jgi:hypothetical protein
VHQRADGGCRPCEQIAEIVRLYAIRNWIEMVFTQLEMAVRPFGGGREHVADLELIVSDDHAVDEQSPLGEDGGGEPGPDGWQKRSIPPAVAWSSSRWRPVVSSCRCWAVKLACLRSRSWRLRWSSVSSMISAR